jgi:hypothetical protein
MTQVDTSLIQEEKKFIQCEYHIKDALSKAGAHWRCQGSVDHESGKHILPKPSPPHGAVKTIGSWYPTFEEANAADRNLQK